MIQAKETHDRIIKVLKARGPSLPMHISKEMGMNSLFVSAFLSEMVNEKKIKVSHMKVGGSPLYFLEGQEEKLEGFSNYLHPRENEAFTMLKDRKILKDEEMEPAIRVALRSIRDFAVGFKKDEEIYWRYISVSEEEVGKILESKVQIPVRKIIVSTELNKPREKKAIDSVSVNRKNKEDVFENPLVVEKKSKKQKPKSEFVLKVIDFINGKGFKVIEEREHKAKEFSCIVQIRSELGLINFLCQAKDKKKISEGDLKKLLSGAQKIPLPAFFIYNGELSKKGRKYIEKYGSVLKVLRLKQ